MAAPPQTVVLGGRLGVIPCHLAASIGPSNSRAQPTPATPLARSSEPSRLGGARACSPKCVRIFSITGCQGTEALAFARHQRSSGPLTSGDPPQVGRDDLALAAAVRAVRHVDLEHALEPPSSGEPRPGWSAKSRRVAVDGSRRLRGPGRSLRLDAGLLDHLAPFREFLRNEGAE